MLRDRLRSNRPICRIDVSAFVSVLTALLFLFMVYRVFTESPHGTFPHHGLIAALPVAAHAHELSEANREDALVVTIMRDGRTFFDVGQVAPDDLPSKLRRKLRAGAPPVIFIRAEAQARYRSVSIVLDSIRSAGLTQIAFLTEKPALPGLTADEKFRWLPME